MLNYDGVCACAQALHGHHSNAMQLEMRTHCIYNLVMHVNAFIVSTSAWVYGKLAAAIHHTLSLNILFIVLSYCMLFCHHAFFFVYLQQKNETQYSFQRVYDLLADSFTDTATQKPYVI